MPLSSGSYVAAVASASTGQYASSGLTFFLLAAYLVIESIRDLISQVRPEAATAGLIVTAAALLVMPPPAAAKQRTGQALGNQTLITDAAESKLCALTSGAALLGVGLNAWLGWWWATRPPPW